MPDDSADQPADSSTVPSVNDRLLAAGLSPERIAAHLKAGRVLLDGHPVTDLDQPAPSGSRCVIGPS